MNIAKESVVRIY